MMKQGIYKVTHKLEGWTGTLCVSGEPYLTTLNYNGRSQEFTVSQIMILAKDNHDTPNIESLEELEIELVKEWGKE